MPKSLVFLFSSLFIMSCARTQALRNDRVHSPSASNSQNAFPVLSPKGPIDGSTLLVLSANITAVPIGENASARISATVDARADFISYEVTEANDLKVLKTGKFTFIDEVLHDLPAGTLKIFLRACLEEANALPEKDHCGARYELIFYQKANSDQELTQYLKTRQSIIDAQKEYGQKVISAIGAYEQSTSGQSNEKKEAELVTLLSNAITAGPTKIGDMIAKSSVLEDADNKKNKDKKEGEENSFDPSNGVALLFLAGTMLSRYDNHFSEADSVESQVRKNREQLTEKVLEATKLHEQRVTLQTNKKNSKNKDRFNTRQEVELDVRLEAKLKEINEISTKNINYSPLKNSSWTKKIGIAMSLGAAAYIIFAQLDDNLLKSTERIFEIVTFGLASDTTSPKAIFFTELGRQERELLKLKAETAALDEKIWDHIMK